MRRLRGGRSSSSSSRTRSSSGSSARGASRGLSTSSSGCGGARIRASPVGPQRGAAPRAAHLLSERVSARRRARMGARPGTAVRSSEPRAERADAAHARRAPCRAGAERRRARLRGTPRPAEGARRRARGAREVPDVDSRHRRRRARAEAARATGARARSRRACTVPRAASRETRVLRLFRAADAAVLPSAWENLPHTVVEALAVGTPVIATAVGGVPEVVRDGENGLLVAPNDPAALGAAIARFFADGALRERLGGGGAGLGRRLYRGGGLRGASRSSSSGRRRDEEAAPHGRSDRGTRFRSRRRSPRSSTRSTRSSTCACSGARAAASADAIPASASFRRSARARSTGLRSTRSCRSAWRASSARFRPDAVLVQGAQETALASSGASSRGCRRRSSPTSTGIPRRRRGSTARRSAGRSHRSPMRFARDGLARSDGVRTISAYTSRLVREAGVEPSATFAAFMDLEPFVGEPAAAPRAAHRALRRRARALQGGRRARRGLAPRGAARSGRDCCTSSAAGRFATFPSASWPSCPSRRAGPRRCPPPRSRGRSTTRPCSCCRRAPRASGAWSSRRSAADAVSSGAASAGFRISSRTARTGSSSRPRTRRARRRARARALRRSLAERLGAAARVAVEPWLATPEEYAAPRLARDSCDARRPESARVLHSRDAGGPREAAPEERRLPGDRRDGERRRRARRRGRPDAPRAHVPQGQRPLAESDDGSHVRCSRSRWRSSPISATRPSRSRRCATTTSTARPLPVGAVLITFDDGYRDNLENALPVLRRHGYPGRALRADRVPRRRPAAPARGGAADARGPQRDARLGRSRRARSRRCADRVARDRPPAALRARAGGGNPRDRALEAAARGAARAGGRGVCLREGLACGLPARAREPRPAGGLQARVHVRLGRERAGDRPVPAPPLQHRAVPGADVRARPRGRVRSDLRQGHRVGTYARRAFNAALGTATR